MRGFEASKPRLSGGVAALIAIVAIVFGMTACQGQDPATESSGEAQPVEQKEVIAEDVSESMGVTLPSGSSYGSVPTNILSQGMVNSYGDWIYYYKVSDLLTPHRVHPDGSGDESMEWLGSSVIALNDGWAYYLGSDYCIYRMRPDGGEKEQLSTSQAYWLNVADDWLYFTDHPGVGPATKGEIWKMRVDGSGAQLLREEPSEYLPAYEGWL